jgi:hypothetical protein
MDSFGGNDSDPLSLHKYLYCQASPINRIDPSGHEDLCSISTSMFIVSQMTMHEARGANAALRGAQALFGGDDVTGGITYGLDIIEAVDNAVAVATLAVGATYGGYKLITFISNGSRTLIKNLRVISALEANAGWLERAANSTGGWLPPYRAGSNPREFTTAGTIAFKRVIVNRGGGPRRVGRFLVRAEEIAGMTKPQIKDHLGLDDIPSQIQDVSVPSGVEMRVGYAGEQPAFGSKGGGVQYELLVDQPPTQWFSEPTAF